MSNIIEHHGFKPPDRDKELRKAKADGIRAARDYIWQKFGTLHSGLTALAQKVEDGQE